MAAALCAMPPDDTVPGIRLLTIWHVFFLIMALSRTVALGIPLFLSCRCAIATASGQYLAHAGTCTCTPAPNVLVVTATLATAYYSLVRLTS